MLFSLMLISSILFIGSPSNALLRLGSQKSIIDHFNDLRPKLRNVLKLSTTLLKSIPSLMEKIKKMKSVKGNSYLRKLLDEVYEIIRTNTTLGLPLNDSKVVFHLFDPNLGRTFPETLENLAKLDGKMFFLIHGWTEDLTDVEWYDTLSGNIVKTHPGSHVVQVDWGAFSNSIIYPLAALRTEEVGNLIARRLMEMMKYGLKLANVVVIGFSLGAQVSAQIGEAIKEKTQTKLPEIIALDPAGPLFEGLPEDRRLDGGDAEKVLVLHTDGTMNGYKNVCGTTDFYPNGGQNQPGCGSASIVCSHLRSWQLLTNALLHPDMFPAFRCQGYSFFITGKCDNVKVNFGDLEVEEKGTFFFNTSQEAPFYLYNKQTTVEIKFGKINL